nr:hypothetical protein [Actinomyces sp.]
MYDSSRYRELVGPVLMPSSSTFLVNHLLFESPVASSMVPGRAPKQLFAVWFGGEMGKNRRHGVDVLRRANPDLQFHLITEENLGEWVVDGYPIHPAFSSLSYNHRADYVRAYLMHHHGGGYSDIKAVTIDWARLIDQMNGDDVLWVIGPAERDYGNVSPAVGEGPLGREQQTYFNKSIFQSCFACRPHSPLTYEWLAETERRLSYFSDLLAQSPADLPWGDNLSYPVPWNAVHGQIFSPLNLKYIDHVEAVPGILNDFGPHR